MIPKENNNQTSELSSPTVNSTVTNLNNNNQPSDTEEESGGEDSTMSKNVRNKKIREVPADDEIIEVNGSSTEPPKVTDSNMVDVDLRSDRETEKDATCINILPDTNYPTKDSPGLPKEFIRPKKTEGGSAAGSSGSRGSMIRRASTSLNNMRRKSIEVVKLTFEAYRGMVLAMCSATFFTLTAVIVKYLKDIHPGQMACFRFMGILLFTIPMIITAEVNPFGPKEKRHFLLLRGIAGATSLYLRYSALHYLPIANATVIVLSMPVFVCIFARIFLKEPCGIFHCVAIGITLIGIGFTSRISSLIGLTSSEGVDRNQELMGLLYSLGATFIGASVYIFVRKVKDCHNSVILFNFSIVAIVETSILTGIDDGFQIPEGNAPWLLMALAILSFYAQLLLTKALQLEEASLVSVTRASSEVVCAFIFQIVIFHQLPDLYACIGALLVTSSVLLTSARKWVVTLPGDHLGRKLLGFTLK